jgi:hypothetical protein
MLPKAGINHSEQKQNDNVQYSAALTKIPGKVTIAGYFCSLRSL